jgi:hypothetical protein
MGQNAARRSGFFIARIKRAAPEGGSYWAFAARLKTCPDTRIKLALDSYQAWFVSGYGFSHTEHANCQTGFSRWVYSSLRGYPCFRNRFAF